MDHLVLSPIDIHKYLSYKLFLTSSSLVCYYAIPYYNVCLRKNIMDSFDYSINLYQLPDQ